MLRSLIPTQLKTLIWNALIAPEVAEKDFLESHRNMSPYDTAAVAAARLAKAKPNLVPGHPFTLSPLLDRAIEELGPRPVRILDFGGAFGEQAIAVRNKFGDDRISEFVVVESENVVSAARNAGIVHARFCAAIPNEPFDIVFTSGTLQCLPAAEEALSGLLALRAPYVVLARNCLSGSDLYFRRRLIELRTTAYSSLRSIRDIETHFSGYEIVAKVENRTGVPRRDPRLWGHDYLLRLRSHQ